MSTRTLEDHSTTNGCTQEPEDSDSSSKSLSEGSSYPSSQFAFDEEGEEMVSRSENVKGGWHRNGVSGDYESPDALLAFELNQLTFKERGDIDNVIHGVQMDYTQETPELLRTSLERLTIAIEASPERDKKAYELSQAFPKTYVNNEEFRLIFLRCECFDIQKAAKRMLGYLNAIRSLFGGVVLERDICMSDLDKEAEAYLRAGPLQLFPGRDRSGRRVGGNFPLATLGEVTAKHRMQAALYVMMKIAKNNIDVQKEGVVSVLWAHGIKFDDVKTRSFVHAKLVPNIPLRFCSLHICLPSTSHPDSLANMMKTMYIYAIGPEYRRRLRVHFGSAIECLYALQTFEIQSHDVPINTNTGKIKHHNHDKWLERQQRMDESRAQNKPFEGIECPTQKDILFGRGWPKMSHPGNAIFRNVIETRLEEYNDARSKREKTTIAWSIVCELKEIGSRFLKQEEGGWWIEVSNEVARQKVSIGLRDARKASVKTAKLADNNNNNNNNNSTGNGKLPLLAPTNVKRKSDQAHAVPVDRNIEKDTKNTRETAARDGNDDAAGGGSCAFLETDGCKRMRFALGAEDSPCCD